MCTGILDSMKLIIVKNEANPCFSNNHQLRLIGGNPLSGLLFTRKNFNPIHPKWLVCLAFNILL